MINQYVRKIWHIERIMFGRQITPKSKLQTMEEYNARRDELAKIRTQMIEDQHRHFHS